MAALTKYALAGYADDTVGDGYAAGSSAYIAWWLGRWLRTVGRPPPANVEEAPGYAVVLDGREILVLRMREGRIGFVPAAD